MQMQLPGGSLELYTAFTSCANHAKHRMNVQVARGVARGCRVVKVLFSDWTGKCMCLGCSLGHIHHFQSILSILCKLNILTCSGG
jgi:hypothetical protein